MNAFCSFFSLHSSESVCFILFWIAQLFYTLCFVPQILVNHRLKSGTGVSDLLMLGYLNAYLFLLFYIFGVGLPFAYKVMVPIQTLFTIILIAQRLFYDTSSAVKFFWFIYVGNCLLFILFIPFALKNPYSIGHLFGWFNLGFSIVNQLPQVIKIYRDKSVEGFSIYFVLFTGFAALCETIGAVVACLPFQTWCTAIRGLILSVVFCVQFLIYKK
jgi:uncharacterized protein with PQ loop repeat